MAETIQQRLMRWAGAFLVLQAATLTLSPAVRLRSWTVDYRWSHWLAVAIWFAAFWALTSAVRRRIPDHDVYLIPVSALLCGWGILTVWRLDPTYGLRQSIWLIVSVLVLVYALYRVKSLNVLRRHKYVLLTAGIALTALTLIFGTNPAGPGPRLWPLRRGEAGA